MPLCREKIAIKALSSRLLKIEATVLYGVSLGRTILNVRPGRDGSSLVACRQQRRQADKVIADRSVHLRRQRLTGEHSTMKPGFLPLIIAAFSGARFCLRYLYNLTPRNRLFAWESER